MTDILSPDFIDRFKRQRQRQREMTSADDILSDRFIDQRRATTPVSHEKALAMLTRPSVMQSMMGGVAQTAQEFPAGINRLLTGLVNLIPGVKLTPAGIPYDLSKTKLQRDHPVAFGAGEMTPYLAVPEFSVVGKGVPFSSAINSILSGMLYAGIPGSAASLKQGGEMGALGGLLGGAFHGLGAGWNLVGRLKSGKTEKALETLGSPEELDKLPASVYMESPSMNRVVNNLLARIPWTGITGRFQRARDKLVDMTQNIMRGLRGQTPHEKIAPLLGSALNEAHNNARQAADHLYDALDTQAKKEGISVSPRDYRNTLDNILKEDKDAPPELKLDKKTRATMQRYLDELNNATYRPTTMTHAKGNRSFNQTSLIRGRINDHIADAIDANHKHVASQWLAVKKALESDMQRSAEGTPVYDTFLKANNYYRDTLAPFTEDPEINRFVRGKKRAEDIPQTFVKTGLYEKPQLLNTLLSKIPSEYKSLLAYAHLSPKELPLIDEAASHEDKAKYLSTVLGRFNKLGDQQKSLLFDPNARAELEAINTIAKRAPNQFFNPPTGQQAIESVLAKSLLGGAVGGTFPHAVIPAYATTVALGHALTSPVLRKELMRQRVPKNVSRIAVPMAMLIHDLIG